MTIKEIKNKEVLDTMSTGKVVVCVDFKKGEYLDLSTQQISYIMRLVESDATKFYTKEVS